jgi:hypothetical protein
MKIARALCLMVLTLSFAIPAMADCAYPSKPADPPSGTTATHDQMVAAKQTTTKYSDDMKIYLNCLDAEADSQITALGANAKPEQVDPIKNKRDLKYSAAEQTMQKYVDSFNAELRAYKTAQAQPTK